jgi:hypothetical protein
MKTTLDSAHAWFFDTLAHGLNGTLTVGLVEGIKGRERQLLNVCETELGPYFLVQVEATSRYAEVTFSNVISFFVYDESYDAIYPALQEDSDFQKHIDCFLFNIKSSSFRKFVEARTSVTQMHQEPYQEFLLMCEDRIFHILSVDFPTVTFLNKPPDLTIERTETWSSN